MAVPKQKVSKARRDTRNSAVFFATSNAITECPHCHAACKPHTVCASCGQYKGTQRIETKKEKQDKKESKKAAE